MSDNYDGILEQWYDYWPSDNVVMAVGFIMGDKKNRFYEGMQIHTSKVHTPFEEWREGAIIETNNSKYMLGKKG